MLAWRPPRPQAWRRPDPRRDPLPGSHPLVGLVGIDGSGKSTQAARLRARLEARGRPARCVGAWDVLGDPELDAEAFMGRPEQFRAYLARIGSTARCLFIFHALHESLCRALAGPPATLLLEGSWPKYAVLEELLGTPRPLLAALRELFPEPALTLWLDLPPEVAAARRAGFSPYECGGESPNRASFTAFQGKCRARLGELAAELGWVRVDADAPEDEVLARLEAALEGRLPA